MRLILAAVLWVQAIAVQAPQNFPLKRFYDMDIRQVPMTSGPGLLLQNADKGGELAFMWSSGDWSYFLMGLITEDRAIAVGKSLQ